MNNKKELRTIAKEIRKTLDIKTISAILRKKLINNIYYKNSSNIMIFYPLKFEIDLLPLLNDNTKNFYLPRVKDNDIEICRYKIDEKLKKSPLGIYEPVSPPTKDKMDLIIVPALLADNRGYRIGYGGGFYDRLLKKNKTAKTITLLPAELIYEQIPNEKFDQKIDCIIHT